ncbi:tetratricopeptide repeat protein [Streptomyces scabichelini]|uniref:tetratricopeptide repeat protein n=1 Tax=Streptomyces scabichelini TaxID=2711217 RepID=UPI001F49E950|nr:tetratricopeptide repeat protein [Streptomyces scabichelini]
MTNGDVVSFRHFPVPQRFLIRCRHRLWNGLGVALAKVDRFEEAIEAFGNASDNHREFEDWYRAGEALYNMALAHHTIGHPAEARAYYLQAADSYALAKAFDEAAEAQSAADALT